MKTVAFFALALIASTAGCALAPVGETTDSTGSGLEGTSGTAGDGQPTAGSTNVDSDVARSASQANVKAKAPLGTPPISWTPQGAPADQDPKAASAGVVGNAR